VFRNLNPQAPNVGETLALENLNFTGYIIVLFAQTDITVMQQFILSCY
jgi:hypothetical protein